MWLRIFTNSVYLSFSIPNILILEKYLKLDPRSESTDSYFFFYRNSKCSSFELRNLRKYTFNLHNFFFGGKPTGACRRFLISKLIASYNFKYLSHANFTVDTTPSFVLFFPYVLIFQVSSRYFQYLI